MNRLELLVAEFADRLSAARFVLSSSSYDLLRYDHDIALSLSFNGHVDVLQALLAEITALTSPRLADGCLPNPIFMNRELQRSKLREIIRRGGSADPANTGARS